jgi:hypothetical protein
VSRARTVAVAAVALLAIVATASAAAPARCEGAAALHPIHPCTNRSPTVSPRPGDIGLHPATFGCRPVRAAPDHTCTFGAAAARARAHVALIGDSHALHWRAAIEVVARARRWRGFSITTTGCPLSAAVVHIPGGQRCVAWYAAVRAWLRRHPSITTVFVSQSVRMPMVAPGRTEAELKRAGHRRAWTTLPGSVRRVIVLRDVPDPRDDTFECVEQAVAAGLPPLAQACPTPRATALAADPAIGVARSLRSRRIRPIDLSSLFCAPRNCYPVVGGIQVYADVFGHITAAYMRTVGPYLLRRLGG